MRVPVRVENDRVMAGSKRHSPQVKEQQLVARGGGRVLKSRNKMAICCRHPTKDASTAPRAVMEGEFLYSWAGQRLRANNGAFHRT